MEQKTEEPLFILKPNVFNAIVPIFAKNLLYSLMMGAVGFGLFWLLFEFGSVPYTMGQAFFWIGFFVLLFPAIPSLIKLFILHNTKYFFYKTRIVSEFELFSVKRSSAPYQQIVSVTSKVSIWDRICKAGDLTVHTAEDSTPDIALLYIKDPHAIETKIYELMRYYKKMKESALVDEISQPQVE